MNWLCKIFGHSWKCWMACDSYCRWCGITYTEYVKDGNPVLTQSNKDVNKEKNT